MLSKIYKHTSYPITFLQCYKNIKRGCFVISLEGGNPLFYVPKLVLLKRYWCTKHAYIVLACIAYIFTQESLCQSGS